MEYKLIRIGELGSSALEPLVGIDQVYSVELSWRSDAGVVRSGGRAE